MMTSTPHRHRAHTTQIRAWSHCVTPYRCAADPEREAAHGNIVERATCRCGATRDTEVNAGRRHHGPWLAAAVETDHA